MTMKRRITDQRCAWEEVIGRESAVLTPQLATVARDQTVDHVANGADLILGESSAKDLVTARPVVPSHAVPHQSLDDAHAAACHWLHRLSKSLSGRTRNSQLLDRDHPPASEPTNE
jgi:hypothetical protein